MGANFLGLEEVIEHLGITPTPEEWKQVSTILYSEETLTECKNSHFLFLGVAQDNQNVPLTIKKMGQMFCTGRGKNLFASRPAESHQCQKATSDETLFLRWYLIRKSSIIESRGRPYEEQEKLLACHEYRERAVVYIYLILLALAAREEMLFENETLWCQDGYDGPNPTYHRIYVKNLQGGALCDGIRIGFLEIPFLYPDQALVPAHKPDLVTKS